MPVDSAGNISRPASPVPVTGQTADAPQVNIPIDDIYSILNMLAFLDGRKPLRGNLPMGGYRASGAGDAVDPQDLVTLSQVQAMIAAVGAVPTGAMIPLASATVPAGWLVVNGQEVSRTTYAALWAHAQASGMLAATQGAKTHGQFGPGNGTTTFTLPNLYADDGYFIRPMASGRTIGSVQADELKTHTHSASTSPAGAHTHTGSASGSPGGGIPNAGYSSTTNNAYTVSWAPDHVHGVTVNATGGAETRPKNIAYPVLIKT